MTLLADTNLFIKFCLRLPLPKRVESTFIEESTERQISAASIMELYRLWQKGKLPDNPDTWLDLALSSWTVLPITAPIARQSILWPWGHKDPADRLIAATAQHHNVELWHTDTVLRHLQGFPQKYFVNSAG
jgi:PIN domain nuclease of toxin-antitoxin system